MLTDHAEHWPWRQVGPCVYCTCDYRLYQGTPPKTQDDARKFAAAMDDVMTAARKSIEAGTLGGE